MRIPVLLCWQDGELDHFERTFTLTLSWFGCAVSSHNFFQPGNHVRLYRDSKSIEARVVYSLKDHSTKLVQVGLAFDEDGRGFWEIASWVE